jgi:putative adenylate-forming enzyme
MSGRFGIVKSYIYARHFLHFKSRAQLERWQDRKVRRFVAWVMRHSPFYANHFSGYEPAQWRELPTLDKALMMRHFDELNTVGVTREQAFEVALRAESSRDFSPTLDGVSVGLSSGTSGNRGLFLTSPKEQQRWAGRVLARVLPPGGPHRIAFFLRANNNLYTVVGSKKVRFEYFDLLTPLEGHVARLEALAPTLLVAPPSMLRLLARARADGQLTLAPEKIVSVAEVLDPLDEAFIARAFGQIVHQVYQCTEGFLAHTCAQGTLHLNEDFLVVQKEFLDENLRKFSPIVTDFGRHSQPFVRYRLNDILTERAEPCPCGSVLTALESIEGRCDDLFQLPRASGAGWVQVFPDFVRRAILTTSERIEEYSVRQSSPERVELSLTLPAADRARIEPAVVEALAQLFESLGCRPPIIAATPPPPRRADRKLKRVERLFTVDGL